MNVANDDGAANCHVLAVAALTGSMPSTVAARFAALRRDDGRPALSEDGGCCPWATGEALIRDGWSVVDDGTIPVDALIVVVSAAGWHSIAKIAEKIIGGHVGIGNPADVLLVMKPPSRPR